MMSSMIDGIVESSYRTPTDKEVNMIESDILMLQDELEELEKLKDSIETRIKAIQKEIEELEERKENEKIWKI